MIMCSDNDELINAFLERLITNDVNSGNISQTEVLCNSYKKLLFKSMSDFKAMPVLNWNCIVFCLYHLNQFKKIFTILVENSSTINKFCFEILSLSDIFENIFELSKSSEVMLKCSAQDLIAYLVVCLFKHSHSSCQAYLDLVLDLIAKNAHTNLSCSIDILTSLIIEFKEIDMPGKVTDFLKHFCSNNLLSLNFSANIKVFYSSLYLVKELVNCVSVLNLTDVVLSVISLWLEKVHLKVIDSSYRLIFIKIIHTVLKSSSNTDTKVYFKTAHTFLYVFASNIAEIQADESCFGFGGRLNHSVDKTENAMFGKAEKMIFINTALDAFFICNVDGRESIEEKLQLTETFLFTKDGSFQVCDFFNLFLEQDDSMIEFLLLHLTLNIDLERSVGFKCTYYSLHIFQLKLCIH